ncbi:hypothetical protein EJB05_20057 [Eragrostis curvula]|uniref:Uncharacterized protein n=1 Tax=Eragrostis curvula TaxID=38414 RepID=A0A5J9UY16_9POAL|nr:hypothetical protein EJB05_20057 [Eragrostis curvula]
MMADGEDQPIKCEIGQLSDSAQRKFMEKVATWVSAGPLGLLEKVVHVLVPPLTEDDGYLLVRLLVGVVGAALGVDDDGAVHGDAVEIAVRVPPERALLLGEDDTIGEVGAGLDGTLRDVLRPIEPRVPRLVHAMPAFRTDTRLSMELRQARSTKLARMLIVKRQDELIQYQWMVMFLSPWL